MKRNYPRRAFRKPCAIRPVQWFERRQHTQCRDGAVNVEVHCRGRGPCLLDVLTVDQRLLLDPRIPDQPAGEQPERHGRGQDEQSENRAEPQALTGRGLVIVVNHVFDLPYRTDVADDA
jgi:hypothetical protein